MITINFNFKRDTNISPPTLLKLLWRITSLTQTPFSTFTKFYFFFFCVFHLISYFLLHFLFYFYFFIHSFYYFPSTPSPSSPFVRLSLFRLTRFPLLILMSYHNEKNTFAGWGWGDGDGDGMVAVWMPAVMLHFHHYYVNEYDFYRIQLL